jgi:Protoglobin
VHWGSSLQSIHLGLGDTDMRVAKDILGYAYGETSVSTSPVSMDELNELMLSVKFTEEDRRSLHLAGEVLADQTKQIVSRWRSEIIADIPHLAQHSRTPEGEPLPKYLAQSSLRFEQWILDTCFRPYDQDWLNYQQEIALRHTSLKKSQTDAVNSTEYVPYRQIVAFTAVINDTIRGYLAVRGHSEAEVEAMHRAWCKSLQIQIAIWGRAYMDLAKIKSEW